MITLNCRFLRQFSNKRHILKIAYGVFILAIVFTILHIRANLNLPIFRDTGKPESSFLKSIRFPTNNAERKLVICDEIWDSTIKKNADGTFTINVPLKLNELGEELELKPYVPEYFVRRGGGDMLLSYQNLSEINDTEWLTPVNSLVYDMYPQDVPVPEVMENLTLCKIIQRKPINEAVFRFHHVSSTVCHPDSAKQNMKKKLDLVVIMKTAVDNFQGRNHFRNFMNYNSLLYNFTVRFVFTIGLPATSNTNFLQRDGFNITLGGKYGEKMKNASSLHPSLMKELEEEISVYRDINVGDFEDTYFNLTVKLFHTIQWAAHFCRHEKPVFLLLDDEYIFNFTYMQNILMSSSRNEKANLNPGARNCRMPVLRNTAETSWSIKWDLSKKEMPWPHFPCYTSGFSTLMGYDVVKNVSLAMLFTKTIHVDDAFLGLVMHKAGITIHNEPNMHAFKPHKTDEKFVFNINSD